MEGIKKMIAFFSLIIVFISFLFLMVQLLHPQNAFNQLQVQGVLDRFENKQAIILIEELDEEMVVPIQRLPKGSEKYTWFDICITKKGFKIISINKKKVDKHNHRLEQLLETLRE